jgi:TonB family protein
MEKTRKCPYCGEEIMADARKCRHCGEWLTDEAEPKKEYENQSKQEVLAETKLVEEPMAEIIPNKPKESLFKSCFWEQITKHYCDFKGNVDRKTFWICYLYWVLVMWVIGGISVCLPSVGNALMWIVSLGLTLPFLGLSVRRLHDIGKKGIWILIALVPLVGPIWYIVLMAKKGETQNSNKWNVKDTIITIAMLVVSLGLFAVGLFALGSETDNAKESLFGSVQKSETEEIEEQVLEAYKDGSIHSLMTPDFKAAEDAAMEAQSMFGEIFFDADMFYNTQDEMPDNIAVSEVNLVEKDKAHVKVTLGFASGYTDVVVLVMVKDQNAPNGKWFVDDVISYYVNDKGETVCYSQKEAMNEFVDEQYGSRAYVPDESESGFSYYTDEQGNEWMVLEDGTLVNRGNVNEDDEAEVENVETNVEADQNEVVEGEKEPAIEEEGEDEIFAIVEEMPQFPGGEVKLMEFIAQNIKYPQIARESGIQGRVFIGFVVEPDGSISNVKLLRGIGGGCDEEAIRVINSMPKWRPGKQHGKTVRVAYQIPVIFKMQ